MPARSLFHFKRGSLRLRLVAASVLVEVVLLAILIGNSARLIDNAARSSVAATLAQITPMLNAAAAPYLLERDYSGLQDMLTAIVSGPAQEISYVVITTRDGREIARAGLSRDIILAPPSTNVSQALDDSVYRAEYPVAVGGEKLGVMRLGLSTRIVAETRSAIIRQGLLIACAEVVASIIVLGLLGIWLTHHLERAAAASRAIGDGDYSIRLPELGGAEVADLARAVNRMGEEVEHRMQALRDLNAELEQRIVVRTAEQQHSLREQQIILDNAMVGILFLRDRVILRCNPVWADMLGYTPQELEGRSTRIYYDSDAAWKAQGKLLYPAIQAGQASNGETEFRRRDGTLIVCSFRGKAIDPADLSQGTIWVLQDITARKVAERALEQRTLALQNSVQQLRSTQLQLVQAEKLAALGQLVSGIAHELNTPIGNAVTSASALVETARKLAVDHATGLLTRSQFERLTTDCREISNLVLSNAQRAAELIDRFKLVAADHTHDERCGFSLNDQVRNVLEGLGPRLRARQVAVTLDMPVAVAMESYPGLLTQVLVGVINNAIDHAFQGIAAPALVLRVRELPDTEPAMAEITITDNGAGIAAPLLPRVFEPFYTTRRGAGHSGLGLHILYNLVVTALEGHIAIASRLGAGAIVTVTLARRVSTRVSKREPVPNQGWPGPANLSN